MRLVVVARLMAAGHLERLVGRVLAVAALSALLRVSRASRIPAAAVAAVAGHQVLPICPAVRAAPAS